MCDLSVPFIFLSSVFAGTNIFQHEHDQHASELKKIQISDLPHSFSMDGHF